MIQPHGKGLNEKPVCLYSLRVPLCSNTLTDLHADTVEQGFRLASRCVMDALSLPLFSGYKQGVPTSEATRSLSDSKHPSPFNCRFFDFMKKSSPLIYQAFCYISHFCELWCAHKKYWMNNNEIMKLAKTTNLWFLYFLGCPCIQAIQPPFAPYLFSSCGSHNTPCLLWHVLLIGN